MILDNGLFRKRGVRSLNKNFKKIIKKKEIKKKKTEIKEFKSELKE